MECISINATAAQLMDNGSAAPASADISLEAPQSPVAACGKPCVVPHAPRKPSTNTSAPPCGRTINRVAVPHVAPAAPRSETPFRPNAAAETEQRVPVAMTKAQRRHALCMQITEAARYQRGFYSAEGRPKETLQIAKQNSVTKSKVALHVLPALRVRKSVSGTAAASSGSYMMLSDTALTALLRDINLLLGPEVEKDYTPDVMNQVWGLKLYQPSVYPMFPPLKPTPSMTPAPRRPSV